ncbi:phage integrase family protein [Ralstonia pseudosolanacearum]
MRLWFAAPLAKRLTDAGVATLGALMALANDRGRAWWRRVPRIRHRGHRGRRPARRGAELPGPCFAVDHGDLQQGRCTPAPGRDPQAIRCRLVPQPRGYDSLSRL